MTRQSAYLARAASALDVAIARIRLDALDLTPRELGRAARIRVLVRELDAFRLEGEALALARDPLRRGAFRLARRGLRERGLHVRAAPLGGWTPDFTVFGGEGGPEAVLLGLHRFRRPYPHRGPAWAAAFGPPEAVRAAARFEALWEGAHDVGPAVRQVLDRVAERVGGEA